jgi:rare lipoprotein A
MRRTIGISLACFVTSACAIGETTAESPGEATGFASGNAEIPAGETPSSPSGSEGVEPRHTSFELAANECSGGPDRYCGPGRPTGSTQFGKAVWYDLVGKRTASGEILDRVTPTAAHRSLPLASYATVTNLDNGCSVVVKINDRGPFTRGRILDLSPRAADALDIKRAGVAEVAVEPLVDEAVYTIVMSQNPNTAVAQ